MQEDLLKFLDLFGPTISHVFNKIRPGKTLADITEDEEEALVERLTKNSDFVYRVLCYVIADALIAAKAESCLELNEDSTLTYNSPVSGNC